MTPDIVSNIYAFINSVYPVQYPNGTLVLENQPFDFNSAPALFLELEVEFSDSLQANLSVTPKTRYIGAVNVTAYMREGTGTLEGMRQLAWLAEQLKYRTLPLLQLENPKILPSQGPRGWAAKLLTVPFVSDPV